MDVECQVSELLRPFGMTEKYIGVFQLTLNLLILLGDSESLHAVQKRVYMVIAERFCVNWKSIGLTEAAQNNTRPHLEPRWVFKLLTVCGLSYAVF